MIIGGNGADRLLGGPGDDLLIAGTTAYDADADALAALLAVWAGPGSYGDHIAALMNAGATIHLITDGTSPTVQDDGAADRLTGAAGKDWFLASVPQDAVTGRLGAEFLNGAKGAAHGHQNGNGGHGHGH